MNQYGENLPFDDALADMLERADGGSALDAKDALLLLAQTLSTTNTHPATGQPLPVPDCVRDYLARAFFRMSNGEAPAKALNLATKAPQKWRLHDKKLACSLVLQLKDQEAKGDNDLFFDVADLINEHIREPDCSPTWSAFKKAKKPISGETIKTWFYQLYPVSED